jgi:serine O-acetyltransferase
VSKVRTSINAQSELEGIIDRVEASYGRGREIDSLESSALPNERQVVEALRHLKHVIFVGFYSARDVTSVNLRQNLGEHLYAAFTILVEQVARAVVYRRKCGGIPETEDISRSERAVLDVLAEIPRIRCLLDLDVQAAFAGDPAAQSTEEIIFSYPSIEAISVYRIAHEFYLREVPMIPRIMTEFAHGQTGIDIHPGARIGEGFFIDHGTGVVIGETTEIGNNVKLYQGVTLGAESIPRDQGGQVIRSTKRHPTLEDNVTVYAGATILGGTTTVGAGSVIGSNVWLTKSVPAGSKVTYQAPRTEVGAVGRARAAAAGD